MTDYIISEDEMKNIIDLTEEMCETPGWVINVQPIANRRMDITNKIRSRTLSDEVERAYRHGFNDGQAEGMEAKMATALGEFNWMKPMCFGRHDAICDTRCAWVVRKRCIQLKRGEP